MYDIEPSICNVSRPEKFFVKLDPSSNQGPRLTRNCFETKRCINFLKRVSSLGRALINENRSRKNPPCIDTNSISIVSQLRINFFLRFLFFNYILHLHPFPFFSLFFLSFFFGPFFNATIGFRSLSLTNHTDSTVLKHVEAGASAGTRAQDEGTHQCFVLIKGTIRNRKNQFFNNFLLPRP